MSPEAPFRRHLRSADGREPLRWCSRPETGAEVDWECHLSLEVDQWLRLFPCGSLPRPPLWQVLREEKLESVEMRDCTMAWRLSNRARCSCLTLPPKQGPAGGTWATSDHHKKQTETTDPPTVNLT